MIRFIVEPENPASLLCQTKIEKPRSPETEIMEKEC
jgi:hypothetical protein